MKVELQAGDTITIPNGCKATIEDNQIIIEEKQNEFKDGDILHSRNHKRVVIFANYSREDKHVFNSYFNSTNDPNTDWFTDHFRHATEEEKQKFFDELKAKGLHWNAVEKQMEKFKERASKGGRYLYVDHRGEVISVIDFYDFYDNDRFKVGNYYLPESIEEAKLVAKAIKAIYQKRFKI